MQDFRPGKEKLYEYPAKMTPSNFIHPLNLKSHYSVSYTHLSAADNIFFNQSLEIISVIFHFHYQWDESDLKQR